MAYKCSIHVAAGYSNKEYVCHWNMISDLGVLFWDYNRHVQEDVQLLVGCMSFEVRRHVSGGNANLKVKSMYSSPPLFYSPVSAWNHRQNPIHIMAFVYKHIPKA